MKQKIFIKLIVLVLFESLFLIRYKYLEQKLPAIVGMKMPEKTFEQYVIGELMVYFFIAYLLSSILELVYFSKRRKKNPYFKQD